VVLMSAITSWSLLSLPELIAMMSSSASRRLQDETEFRDARSLAGEDHLAHGLIARLLVAANQYGRLRALHGNRFQTLDQRVDALDVTLVPANIALPVDGDFYVFGLGL